MIEEARIENFRGFRHLQIPMLKPITLIGGKNNVGKTSLLEALALFFRRVDARAQMLQHYWRGIPSALVGPTPEDQWGPMFHNFNSTDPIKIRLKRSEAGPPEELEIRLNPQYFYQPRGPRDAATGGESPALAPQVVGALDFHFFAGDRQLELLHFSVPTNANGLAMDVEYRHGTLVPPLAFISSRQIISPGEAANLYGRLDVAKAGDDVLDFMRILEPRLRALSVVSSSTGGVLYCDIEGLAKKIPLHYQGEGSVRLAAIIMAMALSPKGIVLIDDLGTGIHYSVLEKVWLALAGAAQRYNCQIIATTHSYEFLQSMHGALESHRDAVGYIRLDKLDNADAQASFYDYETLGTALAANWEVR